MMARQMKFVADCLIADCAKETYDLVALPGGMPGGLPRRIIGVSSACSQAPCQPSTHVPSEVGEAVTESD